MPKVSIIMGIYNCAKVLPESIESILAQTYSDWELIMCDDGSLDNTYRVAEYYVNLYPEKIFLYRNKTNRGLNYTLNKCIKMANGVYIARQDGDDRSHIERLYKEADFLDKHPEYAVVGCNIILFDETGAWGQTHLSGEVKKDSFVHGTPFFHPTVMVRRGALLDAGCYSVDSRLLRVEDYHLWFKLYIKGYKGFNLSEAMYDYKDDREAIARRTIKNRINLFHLMLWGYRKLGIPYKYYMVPFKHLVMIFMPYRAYAMIHKKKWS